MSRRPAVFTSLKSLATRKAYKEFLAHVDDGHAITLDKVQKRRSRPGREHEEGLLFHDGLALLEPSRLLLLRREVVCRH